MPCLCRSVNHRAVKAVPSTLPTLINWHLAATLVPPPASHMLYDKEIRPLNERRRGDRKSSRWRRGDTVSCVFPTKAEKSEETRAVMETLYFPGACSGHHVTTPHTSCVSCGVDRSALQPPICILMKKNWFPPNSLNSFVLRHGIHINTIHMFCDDNYVDIEVSANYTLIYLTNGLISIKTWWLSVCVCVCLWIGTDVLRFHFTLIAAPRLSTTPKSYRWL